MPYEASRGPSAARRVLERAFREQQGGIRTHGALARPTVFQTALFCLRKLVDARVVSRTNAPESVRVLLLQIAAVLGSASGATAALNQCVAYQGERLSNRTAARFLTQGSLDCSTTACHRIPAVAHVACKGSPLGQLTHIHAS
jgi:hypothetical protein